MHRVFINLLQVMTCGFGCGSYAVSRPRPAGDEWDPWSLPLDLSLLPYEILPAAFTSSFRLLPSCFWIGVPKVLPFLRPFCRLGKSALRCQSVHAGTLLKTFWKVASLGVLISLSPAVFFLWLYYTTALHFRLFADRTRLLCNICAYSGLICTYQKWYNEYVGRVYGWIDKR